MRWRSSDRPVKETLGALCAAVPFSVAEVALFTAAGIVLLYLGALVGGLIRCRRRGNLLYTRLLGLVCAGVTVYSLFCLLWGVNYYADGFQEAFRPAGQRSIHRGAAGNHDLFCTETQRNFRFCKAGRSGRV